MAVTGRGPTHSPDDWEEPSAWGNQKHIWPTGLDFETLVYFKGNLIHVFLIHFHLTHQNVALEKLFEILVSYIFSSKFYPFYDLFPQFQKFYLAKAKMHSFAFELRGKNGSDRGQHIPALSPPSTWMHGNQLTHSRPRPVSHHHPHPETPRSSADAFC